MSRRLFCEHETHQSWFLFRFFICNISGLNFSKFVQKYRSRSKSIVKLIFHSKNSIITWQFSNRIKMLKINNLKLAALTSISHWHLLPNVRRVAKIDNINNLTVLNLGFSTHILRINIQFDPKFWNKFLKTTDNQQSHNVRSANATTGHREFGKYGIVFSRSIWLASLKFASLFLFQQAEHFCNSIGILQQCSVPSKFPGFERIGNQQSSQNAQEDYAQLFSTLISR